MTLPTSSELRRISPADISLLTRESEDPDLIFLLTLVQQENNREVR